MKLSQLCLKYIRSYVDSSWRTPKINDFKWCLSKCRHVSQTRNLSITNLDTDIKLEYDRSKDTNLALKRLTDQIECIQLSADGMRVSLHEIHTKLEQLHHFEVKLNRILESLNSGDSFGKNIDRHASELIVKGLPERDNEDLPALIIKVAAVIGVQVLPQDICLISRLRRTTPQTAPQNSYELSLRRTPKTIFVRLTSSKLRNYIVESRKRRDVWSSEVDSTFGHAKVHVHSYVSFNLHKLRYLIKVKAGHMYKRIWVSNNCVFVSKSHNSPAIRIENADQLEELLGRRI